MKWLKFHITVGLLAVAALLAGCQSTPPGEQSTTAQPMPEPAVPAGYQKIAPAAIDSSAQILGQTATIFRGVLKNVQFTYDACGGPRTNYVFSDFVRGRSAGASAGHFEVLGGPTPAWVGVSELPQLALDSQYVTFCATPIGRSVPIVGNPVFRIETIAGREVLVHPGRRAVTGWGDDSPNLVKIMMDGKRLKDIFDLPLDLAV